MILKCHILFEAKMPKNSQGKVYLSFVYFFVRIRSCDIRNIRENAKISLT